VGTRLRSAVVDFVEAGDIVEAGKKLTAQPLLDNGASRWKWASRQGAKQIGADFGSVGRAIESGRGTKIVRPRR
jgi:hypothetical protein